MTSWPPEYDRIFLKQIDSTNAEAIRRSCFLEKSTWIMAELQTSGRGRRGRAWLMDRDNFAATLVLRTKISLKEAALKSFVASLALRYTFVRHCKNEGSFKLKWPNDVLLNGGKVAGILLESSGKGKFIDSLIIGIGANLASAPLRSEVDFSSGSPVSVKNVLGLQISPNDFLYTLARSFKYYDDEIKNTGFKGIKTEWLKHAAKLNEEVIARVGLKEIRGIFRDISDDGSLIIENLEGIKEIAAADVYFGEDKNAFSN